MRPRSGRASTANFVDIAPSVFGWGVPAVSLFCYRPQTGSVCPSGGVSFSFVSERKRNQKEREFKGCALKNPPHCTELVRSIKNDMFAVVDITGRASRDEIVRSGKNKKNLQRYNVERTRAFPSIHCDLRSSGEGVAAKP